MNKFLLYILVCLTGVGYAQDQIFKKDNSKVDAKILEINQSEIKYKLFTYQDGPTIIVAKKDVALIIYQNGVHEVINATAPEVTGQELPIILYNYNTNKPNRDSIEKAEINVLLSTKNLISFNMMEPLNGCLGINYIREFAHNYLHVYVPFTVGFANPYLSQSVSQTFNYGNYSYGGYISDFKYSSKTFETGIGIHFQTSGKKAVTHFIGPYFGMAQFNGTFRDGYNYGVYGNNSTELHGFVLNRYYYMLDNGVLFRINKNFNIMMLLGIGFKKDVFIANDPNVYLQNKYGGQNYYGYSYSSFPLNAFKFGLSFGYRF